MKKEQAPQAEEQVKQLQETVYYLRMNRRILLTVLEQIRDDHKRDLQHLNEEIKQLQKSNCRYARIIWQKNKQIVDLQKSQNI
ncbi:MAG: hypothetical protein ACOX05_06660 [Bacillota bacterium]|jgi:hypothetical protein